MNGNDEALLASPPPSVTISLPTADFDVALRWYADLFGRQPDLVLSSSSVEWRLQPGLWLHLIDQRMTAATGAVVRFEVANDAAATERLTQMGAAIGPMRALGGLRL
jgi:hypothetical protein